MIGITSLILNECAPLALQTLKSSIFVPFTNLSLVMAFMFEVLYLGRQDFWTDYTGASLIIGFTLIQSYYSQKADAKKELEQENQNKREQNESKNRMNKFENEEDSQ